MNVSSHSPSLHLSLFPSLSLLPPNILALLLRDRLGNALPRHDVGTDDEVLGSASRHPLRDDIPALLLDLDFDVDEPGALQIAAQLRDFGSAADSAGESFGTSKLFGNVQAFPRDDVGDAEPSALLQNAVSFPQDLVEEKKCGVKKGESV